MLKRILAGGSGLLVIGAAGLALIQSSEGKRNVSYLDSAGIPTICYGHTGKDVKLGQRATDAQCVALLREDIRVHSAGVSTCTTYPFNQNQNDAVVSFTFNVGVSAYCKSTMARKINAGDLVGAAAEFPKWDKATVNGVSVSLKGLAARRARERDLFVTPYTGEIRSLQTRFGALVG